MLEDNDGSLCRRVFLKEKKEGRIRELFFCDTTYSTLLELRSQYPDDEYVFQTTYYAKRVPWHRSSVDRFIKAAGKAVGIDVPLGTHTPRKTFAYHAIITKQYSLTKIQVLLGHVDPAITLRYVALTAEDLKEIYLNMNL